jgi:hypothetical protein
MKIIFIVASTLLLYDFLIGFEGDKKHSAQLIVSICVILKLALVYFNVNY